MSGSLMSSIAACSFITGKGKVKSVSDLSPSWDSVIWSLDLLMQFHYNMTAAGAATNDTLLAFYSAVVSMEYKINTTIAG